MLVSLRSASLVRQCGSLVSGVLGWLCGGETVSGIGSTAEHTSLDLRGFLPHQLRAGAASLDDGVIAEPVPHCVERLVDRVVRR